MPKNESAGCLGAFVLALPILAAWLQHLYTCFTEDRWGDPDRWCNLLPHRDHSRLRYLVRLLALKPAVLAPWLLALGLVRRRCAGGCGA
jgi:hypothetical protein